MPELDLTMNDGSKPLQYIANDWFYMKNGDSEFCDPSILGHQELCEKNKNAVGNLQKTTDNLGASLTQYNDATMLYNRELLFTVNILAGLVLICYYVYVNQSAIPSPAGAIKNIGASGSWTSRLAMSPTAPK